MAELLLLVGDLNQASNDNHLRFAAAFERAGWRVLSASHESVEIRRNLLRIADRAPTAFDLIWPLGFGARATFMDRMQLLATAAEAKFVNSPDVLIHLHGKHRWLAAMPETHTSACPETLHQVLSSGGDWVLKPTAGSFGRDVRLFRDGEAELAGIQDICRELEGIYLMAQRYVPAIQNGERRTLIAGGRLIGSYLRLPGDGMIANLGAGGSPASSNSPDPAELELIEPVARQLASLGAGFATVDTVYPYLMEVNVANPGGLETLEVLEGVDYSDAVVRAITDWAGCRPWVPG